MSLPTQKETSTVILSIGDSKIKASLNDSKSAIDLLSRLPYTITLSRYEFDYCGIMPETLDYNEADKHNGWQNGDICQAGNFFTILFAGQEQSDSHTELIRIGRIEGDLSEVKKQGESIKLRIDLA